MSSLGTGNGDFSSTGGFIMSKYPRISSGVIKKPVMRTELPKPREEIVLLRTKESGWDHLQDTSSGSTV